MMYQKKNPLKRRGGRDWLARLRQFSLTKRRFWLIGALVFFLVFIAGRSGFYAQIRLWHESRRLQSAIELEKKKKAWLQREVHSLSTDLARIEKEVRQDYGMGDAGDIIVNIP
jgi:cell division protein FtsB